MMQAQHHEVASLVSRLVSLSAHELQFLRSDSQIMQKLTETQLLLDQKLHHINKQLDQQQQHIQPQPLPQFQILYHNNSTNNGSNNQSNTMPLQDAQQQPIESFASRIANHLLPPSVNFQYQYQLALIQQQQQQYNNHNYQQQQQQQNPALDLSGHSLASLGCAETISTDHLTNNHTSNTINHDNNNSTNQIVTSQPPQTNQTYSRRPKPLKARRRQVKAEPAIVQVSPKLDSQQPHQLNPNICQLPQLAALENQNHNQLNYVTINCHLEPVDTNAVCNGSNKRYKGEFDEPSCEQVEERQRRLMKAPQSGDDNNHYHDALWKSKGSCACTMGSQFCNSQTSDDILRQVNEWSKMDTRSRVDFKWPVEVLPQDIPLSQIKKYEDLRREMSNGQADFGGASKRKPLGIRSTRQFLLILYCLWGHPGRRFEMQREGYCPHCFAKIRKANEQSTLVRVVNHFNMKHRLGTNPRMASVSPQLGASLNHGHQHQITPATTCPSSPVMALAANTGNTGPLRVKLNQPNASSGASRGSTPDGTPISSSEDEDRPATDMKPSSPNSTPEAAQTLAGLSQCMLRFVGGAGSATGGANDVNSQAKT